MSDLFTLYAVVCYLFNLGFFISEKFKDCNPTAKLGAFISFIFSPVILPVLFGYIYIEKHG